MKAITASHQKPPPAIEDVTADHPAATVQAATGVEAREFNKLVNVNIPQNFFSTTLAAEECLKRCAKLLECCQRIAATCNLLHFRTHQAPMFPFFYQV